MAQQIIDRVALLGTTTDGTTAIVLGTYTLTSGVSYMATIRIVGKDGSGNTVICSQATAAKNVAGTSTLIGSIVNLVAINGDAAIVASVCTFDISAGTLRAKVTGIVATTINWYGYMELINN